MRSQGASATVWMFCASWRRTPQLIAGGRIPRPRNERDVSLMIIAGMASVLVAMIWERKVGDRKSTRLNSSHVRISYAVFCLKKKKKERSDLEIDKNIGHDD